MSDSQTKTNFFKTARRLEDIPPYLFQRIDDLKKAAQEKGIKITSIGIGDPDSPTPPELVDLLYEEAKVVANQKYPEYKGSLEYRKAASGWYERRFGIHLDPVNQVLGLIGSKEGIANLALAVLDPQDTVLVPDPGYPVYAMHSVFVGCRRFMVPLREKNGFLIDFGEIPDKIARNARLLWMNYPNNPTSAVAPIEFFDEAVAWAKKYGVILAHDNPYSEIYQTETPPPSLLNAKGAMDVAIEFNSLSKSFNMTGWRVGMAVGNAELVQALARVKSNIDSGVFTPIQKVAIRALNMPLDAIDPLRKLYAGRRKVAEELLARGGYEVFRGGGTFYVWIRTPKGIPSFDFVGQLIEKTGIITGPGAGWGEHGEGYFRICLTCDESGLKEAIERIVKEYPAR
jgi:LL-diaminopimelate aminotransferase